MAVNIEREIELALKKRPGETGAPSDPGQKLETALRRLLGIRALIQIALLERR